MCLWKMDRISRAKTSNRTERGSKPSIWFRVRCFCWSHFYSDGCCVLSCSVSISRLVFGQLLLFFTILSVFRIARSFGERKGKVKSTSRAVLVHAVERGDLTLPWGNPVLFESPAGRTCFRRLGQPQSVHQLASTRSFLARFFFFFFLSFLSSFPYDRVYRELPTDQCESTHEISSLTSHPTRLSSVYPAAVRIDFDHWAIISNRIRHQLPFSLANNPLRHCILIVSFHRTYTLAQSRAVGILGRKTARRLSVCVCVTGFGPREADGAVNDAPSFPFRLETRGMCLTETSSGIYTATIHKQLHYFRLEMIP